MTRSSSEAITLLGNGWAHVELDNTDGSSAAYTNFATLPLPNLEKGTAYTILFEIANSSGKGHFRWSSRQYAQTYTYPTIEEAADGTYLRTVVTKTDDQGWASSIRYGMNPYIQVNAGASWSGDVRISLYPDGYTGQYMPCVMDAETALMVLV